MDIGLQSMQIDDYDFKLKYQTKHSDKLSSSII